MATTSDAAESQAPPLTKEAKLATFERLFGGRLLHRGSLFLPDSSFYNKLATNTGLTAAARELYKWLGVKPRHISVTYRDKPKHDGLAIPEHFAEHPYQAGAILALYVVRDTTNILGYKADEAFVEFASLEAGLGILVMNGLYPPHDAWEGLLQNLHGHWHANETVIAHAYHPNNYASELMAYAESQQLSQRLWAGYLHTEAQRRMGVLVTPAHRDLLPVRELARRNHARTALLRLVLLAVLGGIVAMTGTYVATQRPVRPSKLATEQYEEVVLRKQAYDACADTVKALSRSSEVNDIFADQELNAQKSRCLSLQNNYNAAVSRYNATLAK